jgi:hypothetical protein
MVNKCDMVLAIWNEKAGGTSNTVKYAQEKDSQSLLLTRYLFGDSDNAVEFSAVRRYN